jgi:D-arabinose 1-dehydrogenase-like Zn-dependent alcohol dehydrogenase
MKKVLFSLMALVALSASVSSCKKCNTCTNGNFKAEYCSKDYTTAQLDVFRATCTNTGGTWK